MEYIWTKVVNEAERTCNDLDISDRKTNRHIWAYLRSKNTKYSFLTQREQYWYQDQEYIWYNE